MLDKPLGPVTVLFYFISFGVCNRGIVDTPNKTFQSFPVFG